MKKPVGCDSFSCFIEVKQDRKSWLNGSCTCARSELIHMIEYQKYQIRLLEKKLKTAADLVEVLRSKNHD
jgi:hypothetical protein